MKEVMQTKLLHVWCYFSNKIYSAVVSCELLHVLFIMLYILYVKWFPSLELLCEWNLMAGVTIDKWAIWGAIKNRRPSCINFCQLYFVSDQGLLWSLMGCLHFLMLRQLILFWRSSEPAPSAVPLSKLEVVFMPTAGLYFLTIIKIQNTHYKFHGQN